MERFRRYWARWESLSGVGRINFFKAAFCLLFINAGLSCLRFSTFRKIFQKIADTDSQKDIPLSEITDTVWAVNTAANLLPFQLLCLPRALAVKYLLRNVPSVTLQIGVEVNTAKAFEAHAWVEKDGSIIIGDWSDSISYQRLWVWN